MTNPADEPQSFVQRVSGAFAQACVVPMFDRLFESPAEVAQLIAVMRREIDRVELRIAAMPRPSQGNGVTAQPVSAGNATAAIGSNVIRMADLDDDDESVGDEGLADAVLLGRRQRSLKREIALLEILAREERPYSLSELLAEIMPQGLADTSGAVVTQLARLKTHGIIDRPADGIYRITVAGMSHLRKQRTRFSGLFRTGG